MAELGNQDRTIQWEAKECRSLFADVMVRLSQDDPLARGVELQDEMGRFNLWAGNIGVFAPLQASLDFRLIDAPEIRSQFLRQLDTLSISLTQLNEATAQAAGEDYEDPQGGDATGDADGSQLSDGDIVDMVQSIHVTIDWLHRLSNLVRKASFGSQNQRAARFPLQDEAGNDITECLAGIFKHLIKRECGDISDQILNRLAQTMIIRRRRVLYRRSRQKRWALQQETYRPRQLDLPTELPPVQESDEPSEDHEGSELTENVALEPEKRATVAPSGLTVTTLNQQEYKKLAAPSRISRATTAPFQHNEKLLVPPRPRLAKEGNEFVCDYCCLILPSSEAADQDTWANHVKKDLEPYICVFDDCNHPYQIFSSSKDWLAHMRSEHRMSWRCVVRDHPPQIFETREAFLDHMRDAHNGKFRKEQPPFIAESSARALSPTVPACPFCAGDSGDIESHVAQHLCHFALQSLPWPDQLDQGSEVVSGSEMNSSISEDVERETLKDKLDDSLSFVDAAHEWLQPLDTEPMPPWDDFVETIFQEPDEVVSGFAVQAARRAATPAKDNHGEPKTLDEEIRQIKEQFPSTMWTDADTDTRLLRASLRGPWGFAGEQVVLNVKITVPHAYPIAQAPSFLIEKDENTPETVRETLQREVHEICQLYSQRKEACLATAFSYLVGERDLASSLDIFSKERGHAVPLGDMDEEKPPATPDSQPDGIKFTEVADEQIKPGRTDFRSKSGYLTRRGNAFGSRTSRFYLVDGPQLKYYDAEGGSHLGSIELQGAKIGRQQSRDRTSLAPNPQYNHALFIREPRKGSSMIQHILCADSDEERDLWVEALFSWINYTDSDEVKVPKDKSQSDIPQCSTFLIQEPGESGHFHPVEQVGRYASIASASIGSSSIDCRLDLTNTEFGTFKSLPGGIIYMDTFITAPQNTLQSVTITVTLDYEDPDLRRVVWSASGNAVSRVERPTTVESYGPTFIGIRKKMDVNAENSFHVPQTMGLGFEGTRAQRNTTMTSGFEAWKLSGEFLRGKNFRCYSVRWHISNNSDALSLSRRPIHTGLVFEGGGQPFSLTVEIDGKSSKLSDRIRQTSIQLATANRNSTNRGKMLLNWCNGNLYRSLDDVAWSLDEDLKRKNEHQIPQQTRDPRIRGTIHHDFDAPRQRVPIGEGLSVHDSREAVLSSSPVQHLPALDSAETVDQSPSPGPVGGDRASQQQRFQVGNNFDEILRETAPDLRSKRFNLRKRKEFEPSGSASISSSEPRDEDVTTAPSDFQETTANTLKSTSSLADRVKKAQDESYNSEKPPRDLQTFSGDLDTAVKSTNAGPSSPLSPGPVSGSFKADATEPKKITLTPNLLRDGGPVRSPKDFYEDLKQHTSLGKFDRETKEGAKGGGSSHPTVQQSAWRRLLGRRPTATSAPESPKQALTTERSQDQQFSPLARRVSRRVVPGLPRPETFKRQQEVLSSLEPIESTTIERSVSVESQTQISQSGRNFYDYLRTSGSELNWDQ